MSGPVQPASIVDGIRRAVRSPHASSPFSVLDGYRGFAALSVLVFHVAAWNGLVYGRSFQARALQGLGSLGVSIFFVLSGFLLFRPYVLGHLTGTKPRPWPRYLRHRFLRILPAYWVALTALFIILPNSPLLQIGGRPISFGDYVSFYTMTMSFRPGFAFKGLAVAWTLHIEIIFYLVLPMIAWAMASVSRLIGVTPRIRVRTTLVGLALMWVISLMYRTATTWWWGAIAAPQRGWIFNYLDWFAAGMLLATAVAWKQCGGKLPRIVELACLYPTVGWVVALECYVACVFLAHPAGTPRLETMSEVHIRFVLYAVIAVALLAPVTIGTTTRDPMRRLMSSAPLLYFGTISYGVYLWHVIVRDRIVSTSWFHDIGPNFWVLLGATLVMSVIVATASYYLVEKPLLRFKDPRSRGRAGPARRARVPEAVPVGSRRS